MKKLVLLLCCTVSCLFVFALTARAAEPDVYDAQDWCPGLWEGIDASTKELLEQVGLEGIDAEGLLSLSPERIFSVIGDLISGQAVSPVRYCAAAVLAVVLTALAQTLLPGSGAMRQRCETVGHLCVMFVLLSGAGQALRESMAAVTATEDFMALLVPVYTGIIGLSGNPTLALSWGGAVLAFSETATAFFAKAVPAAGALGAAVCAAANLNSENDFSGAAKLLVKAVTVTMGFVAGIFTAVLSVKDVIAAAADGVGVKGMKFVIGQGVPILGGAISDAMGSVIAGLVMVRRTVGAFAVLALFFINLLPVLRLLLWKFVFWFISAAACMLGKKRAAELTDCLNSLLSVVLSVICFNSAVFIIALALVVSAGGR